MSTPSGKLPNLVDLATHVARQARQAQPAEPDPPVESGKDSRPLSPYAPKPANERADARLRVPAKDEADDLVSAYAPKRARLSESGCGLLQPEATDSGRRKEQGGEIQRRTIADREIERIEAILRQLQRRELAAMRLPRGPNLPPSEPTPGTPGPIGSVPGRRTKHSLEPALLPPPPLQPVHNLRVILGIPIACVGAALACYYFVSAPSSQRALKSQVASPPPASAARISTPQTASSRGPRLDSEPDWAPRTTGAQTDLASAGKLNARDTPPDALIASPRPASAKLESVRELTAPPSSSNAGRALPPEEIRLLVEQGEKFISDGDIVTARVIFERAAKAGDAAAALALAAAYDPIVLARLGVLGIDTDVEKARIWYQKAQSLGATQAVDRLDALARR